MATGLSRAGTFCWINILMPGPDEVRASFVALLGWT